ncbi:MAG: phage holin family protein [Clostridium sp.]
MENLMNFIPEQLLVLVVAIYVLGVFFKKIEKVNDTLIPILLMVFAVVFSLVLSGPSPEAFLQGVLCWGAAVGINQTYKQLKKEE